MTIASGAAPASGPGVADDAASPAPNPSTSERRGVLDLSIDARVILVALSAGAGVIHLVMAPIHAAGSSTEAVAFAAAGWFQLACALALALRPTRPWLAATVAGNLLFVGTWAYSRTIGLPYGAHAGTTEAIGQIDTLTVVMQGLLILTAAVLLARPGHSVALTGCSGLRRSSPPRCWS
jgi:hypothetical protein